MRLGHKIVIGDSRQMEAVGSEAVDLVITSPPYWQLKDYGCQNQIGYNQSYEAYINNLNLVWSECYRILNQGSRLCINIGDQFARAVYYGRYKVIPIRTEIIKFCEAKGFDYMGAIIWQKRTTSNTTGGASVMGSYPYPKNGIISIDYEFILIFKKLGKGKKVSKQVKEKSKLTNKQWRDYFSGHWSFVGVRQDRHIAMFPDELPKRLIKMFSFVGDTIVDPFVGSGTTMLVANRLNRNSIGYEINEDFLPIIKDKLKIDQLDIFESEYEIVRAEKAKNSFEDDIAQLPYIFEDPHNLDKKVDPKKMQFGSRIDKENSSEREEYHLVKKIISPELMELGNNLIVRLIGVKEKKSVNGKAINFLQLKTKSQKVFLRFDEKKFDENNNLLVYLYLKNKTFINAHLIKNDLVDVDLSFRYSKKDRFVELRRTNG